MGCTPKRSNVPGVIQAAVRTLHDALLAEKPDLATNPAPNWTTAQPIDGVAKAVHAIINRVPFTSSFRRPSARTIFSICVVLRQGLQTQDFERQRARDVKLLQDWLHRKEQKKPSSANKVQKAYEKLKIDAEVNFDEVVIAETPEGWPTTRPEKEDSPSKKKKKNKQSKKQVVKSKVKKETTPDADTDTDSNSGNESPRKKLRSYSGAFKVKQEPASKDERKPASVKVAFKQEEETSTAEEEGQEEEEWEEEEEGEEEEEDQLDDDDNDNEAKEEQLDDDDGDDDEMKEDHKPTSGSGSDTASDFDSTSDEESDAAAAGEESDAEATPVHSKSGSPTKSKSGSPTKSKPGTPAKAKSGTPAKAKSGATPTKGKIVKPKIGSSSTPAKGKYTLHPSTLASKRAVYSDLNIILRWAELITRGHISDKKTSQMLAKVHNWGLSSRKPIMELAGFLASVFDRDENQGVWTEADTKYLLSM